MNELTASEQTDRNESIRSEIEKLGAALDALQPSGQEKKRLFLAKNYDRIIEAQARHVSVKAILDILRTFGLKLTSVRLKQMMEAERRRRAASPSDSCSRDAKSMVSAASSSPPRADVALANIARDIAASR